MDNPATESNQPLDTTQAAALLGDLLEPKKEAPAEAQAEAPAEQPEPEAAEPEQQEEAPDQGAQKFTVKVDGKDVELTAEQIAEAYKNGLRQADYTRKTMETAEQRKAAEAEANQARAERQQYAANLQKIAAQLEGALSEQSQIDWQQLLNNDPVEYLKQQHLAQQRQAQLQQIQNQRQQIAMREQQEQAAQLATFLQTQQQELLAKLPDWKDPEKAKAERGAIKSYLKETGYDEAAIDSINDHRAVILARKAMLYDQMMGKAQAAAKKVANLPQKVERPGVAEGQGLDKRSAAFQRLGRSGKVEDAAALFSQIL